MNRTLSLADRISHLWSRLLLVRQNLGLETNPVAEPDVRLAELLDSMALVEFVAIVAEDCGALPETIEQSVAGRFDTIRSLAASLHEAGIGIQSSGQEKPPLPQPNLPAGAVSGPGPAHAWLAVTVAQLPNAIQPAKELDGLLGRSAGWLEQHAGIRQRHVWADQDPVAAAVHSGQDCLNRAGLLAHEVGALLVTGEAPPLLAGLAAMLHHRLDLRPEALAVEVGGACTGFLTALHLAQTLVPQRNHVLILALEAPSRFLRCEPGPAGEAAALFGDAAAACLVSDRPLGPEAMAMGPVVLGYDGGSADLLRLEPSLTGGVLLHMRGNPLALRAIRVMNQAIGDLVHRHHLVMEDLEAVVAHGGNGRMASLLARQLGLPPDRVWSETEKTGNLGAASLPVAWTQKRGRGPFRPVGWAAVGAGLTWGAMLSGLPE
jgi:3-oxoacyl-[acyl-carrier-protein] synthase-3